MDESQVRRNLLAFLAAYMVDATRVNDFISWEADLSLEPTAVGQLRNSLDRLALVAAEVADGVRDERRFRELALETILLEAPRVVPPVVSGTAAQAEPISRDVSNRAVSTIEMELTFAGT